MPLILIDSEIAILEGEKDADFRLFLGVLVIYIIIMSYRKHGFPWLSLFIHLYRLSHSAGSLDNIQCLYRAVVDVF